MKKVVLIGDSIRMGYTRVVARELEGKARIIAPEENCRHSQSVRDNLQRWVLDHQPDVVHINAGLHDLARRPEFNGQCPISAEQYKDNVLEILTQIKNNTSATILWALTTPVIQEWHHNNKGFDRFEADVENYNTIAGSIARMLDIAVNDLYTVVMQAGRENVMTPDGVHYTAQGYELLGKAVAAKLRDVL